MPVTAPAVLNRFQYSEHRTVGRLALAATANASPTRMVAKATAAMKALRGRVLNESGGSTPFTLCVPGRH